LRVTRLAAAILVGCALTGGASAASPTVLAFGIKGGNIRPFAVTVDATGGVRADGRTVAATALAPAARRRLVALAQATGFFSLPAQNRCMSMFGDAGTRWIRVAAGGKDRTVRVRGDCVPAFTRLYDALSRAVGLRP